MLVVLLMIVLAFCANINYSYLTAFWKRSVGYVMVSVLFFLQVAILNANYMAARLGGHYDVLFRGTQGKQNGGSVTVDMFSIL